MSEYVAMKAVGQTMKPKTWADLDLKRYSLLFDKIGIQDLDFIKESASHFVEFQTRLDELAWLEQQNIIFTPKIDLDLLFSQNTDLQMLFGSFLRNSFQVVKQIQNGESRANENDELMNILFEERNAILLRMLCVQLEISTNNIVVPLMPYTDYLYENLPHTKNDVVQIVIKHLPVPDNTTPWEAIIDYRNDSDYRHSLLALRRWMRNISSIKISPAEIEEELEYLLSEFQHHMKLHKIKANTETLETIFKAPLEIIEDIVKFKFSKIPEPFFALKKRQLMLMEAELSAPGKEIAYVLKSKRFFDNS